MIHTWMKARWRSSILISFVWKLYIFVLPWPNTVLCHEDIMTLFVTHKYKWRHDDILWYPYDSVFYVGIFDRILFGICGTVTTKINIDFTVRHYTSERRERRDGHRIRPRHTDASSGFAAPSGCNTKPRAQQAAAA